MDQPVVHGVSNNKAIAYGLCFAVLLVLAGVGGVFLWTVIPDTFGHGHGYAPSDPTVAQGWYPSYGVQFSIYDGFDRSRETWEVLTNGRHEYLYRRVYSPHPRWPHEPGSVGPIGQQPIGQAGPVGSAPKAK